MTVAWLEHLRQDAGYAWRSFARSPGFTLVAVLTLALGIGANTAIFGVVRAVLLKPLAFNRAGQIVRLYENVPSAESPNGRPRRIGGMDVRELLAVRERSRALSHAISYSLVTVTMTVGTDSVLLVGAPVTAGTFPMLGVQPILGRWFTPREEAAESEK